MSTIVGIVGGLTLLVIAILHGGGIGIFVDIPGIMIVFGGTAAAIFVAFPLPRVLKVMGVVMQIFKKDLHDSSWVISLFVRLSFKARQQSLLSIEDDIKKMDNRFIRMGLEMVIDGHPGQLIREVMETELDFVQIRHRAGNHIFRVAARLTPAFGLLGTLIGLIHMLIAFSAGSEGGGNIVSTLGSGMATALVTTFYGVLLSNLFFQPIAEKLNSRTQDEVIRNQIAIEAILMLQAGSNPRIMEKKLNSFLPPDMRVSSYEQLMKKQRGAGGPGPRGE